MKALDQTQIDDVDFKIDDNLNVLEASRNFYRFFNEPQESVSLKKYLSAFEEEKLREFLKSVSIGTEAFNIFNFKVRDSSSSCVLSVQRNIKNISVHLVEFNFCRNEFNAVSKEKRELEVVASSVDVNYAVSDGKTFEVKNSRLSSALFAGDGAGFTSWILEHLKPDTENENSSLQLESFVTDFSSGISDKNYSLLTDSGKKLFIHSVKTGNLLVAVFSNTSSKKIAAGSSAETKDGLTGLLNRKTIIELARTKIERNKKECTLLILDIDRFKEYNDTFGHDFGDKVLTNVARVIEKSVENIGQAGRFGGDEFLCILDTVNEDDIRTVTRNIKLGVQWSMNAEEPSGVVTCSIGAARYPENGAGYLELFKKADKCLYIAKNRGRNCYVIYKPEIHDKIIMKNQEKAEEVLSGNYYMDAAESQQKILFALQDKNVPLAEVMEKINGFMNTACILVYDSALKLKLTAGDVRGDFRRDFLGPDYFKYFNSRNFLQVDNVNIFDTISKEVYNMYLSVDVAGTIEVRIPDEKNPEKTSALVCFDVYRPARSFPKENIIFALLCARLIAERL